MTRTLLSLSLLGYILIGCTAHSNAAGPTIREQVDSIVIVKNQRLMHVYNHGKLLKSYKVCLGPVPVGPKHFRNDCRTPEGMYYINGKNPNSHYHKNLGISYPSPTDVAYAKKYDKPSGGDIKIHGLPNDYEHKPDEEATDDWTLGCIAISDVAIDELYAHVAVGTWVNILP